MSIIFSYIYVITHLVRGVFGVGILGKLLFCGGRAACQNKHPHVIKNCVKKQ